MHGPAYASTPEMAEDVAAVAERKRAPQRIRERAKQVWRWCQADGGALWSVSQGEIEVRVVWVVRGWGRGGGGRRRGGCTEVVWEERGCAR